MKATALLFCLVAVAFATEVEKKKKKADVEAKAWPEESWEVNKDDGVITMTLRKAPEGQKGLEQKNSWYPATNSLKYGVKSWATLEADGKHYLVGSKSEKKGEELPTEKDELVLFKMEEGEQTQSDDKVVVKLKPVTPHENKSLERRKKMLGPFDPFFWTFAAPAAVAYTAAVGTLMWPVWAAAIGGTDMEKHGHKHQKLNKLLHNLEDDVHKLSHIDKKAKHSRALEKEKMFPFPCAFGLFAPAFFCGMWFLPFMTP